MVVAALDGAPAREVALAATRATSDGAVELAGPAVCATLCALHQRPPWLIKEEITPSSTRAGVAGYCALGVANVIMLHA